MLHKWYRRFGWSKSVVLAAFLACGIGSAGLFAFAELQAPRANDRQVTLVVTSLMRREHLTRHPLDDEISKRGLKSFLNSLDPMKLYFLQSDIDEFMKRENDIDDMVKKGDISFAFDIYDRFLTRIDERVKQIDKILAMEHDFTADENMIIDRDERKFAKTDEEAFENWRKRIKYDLLVLKSEEEEGEKAIERLTRRYHSFARRMHQTDNDEMLEMYLTAVTTAYDPHTTYMSPSSLDNFRLQMRLSLDGIGAALRMEDGITTVTKIIPGGAADKEGSLKPEDEVISVGQEEGDMVDVSDMKLNDVVDMIRGKAGTVVRLGVRPAAGGKTEIIKITRAKIELKDSEARSVIFEEGKKADGTPYKIGVINLPSFYMDMEGARAGLKDFKSTTRDVEKILADFKEKGVDACVLDLRRNGGGSLTEAINLTGLFIDTGPVVQVKDSDGAVMHYDDTARGMAWDGPLVVLTSKFSASASEILAGAIQDYGRGLVVGDEATHGKGTVQSLLDLGSQLFRLADPPNLGALKITMQQFYRPSGDSTQKRGVVADVVLPSITNHMDVAESDLDYAVEFDRVEKAKFGKLPMVPADMLTKLRAKSSARQSDSEDFKKLLKNIEMYREQKDLKEISLNEKKFFERRKELDAQKEDEKQFEEEDPDQVVRKDYYFEEVLDITVDYAEALKEQELAEKVGQNN